MNNTIMTFRMYFLGLFALLKAGKEVFASRIDFVLWLMKKNYFFNGKSPISYLRSNNGLQFVRGRIRAIEYSNGQLI